MKNREREIRKMISSAGLECSALRLSGGGHYRAEVVDGGGRKAPVFFAGTPGDRRGDLNKLSALKHFVKTGVMRG